MNVRRNQRNARRKGFTIIELMIVIAIMGLLAGAVGVGLMSQLRRAKLQRVELDVDQIHQALKLYFIEFNTYPLSNEGGIDLLVTAGHIEDKGGLTDPWGTNYMYFSPMPDHVYEIHCAGPDRQFGTADDMKYYPPPV